MKRYTEVAIILPNYNSYPYIENTINSVVKQTYSNWKLILVDDCSNEKTQTSLRKFKNHKKIKIFFLKKNHGAGYCRNYAIKKANSKYLAFIDSDDIWKRKKLEKQINFMKKMKYKFTYTSYETFGLGKKKIILPPLRFSYFDFIKNTSIGTSTMIISSKIAKKVKFPNTKICEDYFYKCKILKKVKTAYCLNTCLTKYQIRKNSMQSNYFRKIYWIWKINEKYNKMNFIENFISLFFISFNSLKKYGLRSN